MEKPNAVTVAWYNDAVPEDPRTKKGQMFGHPCAFVNGNMFFGTFGQSVVARVGEAAAAQLVKRGEGVIFEPMAGRAWKEYVQIRVGEVDERKVAALAQAALENTAVLAPKVKKSTPRRPR